MSGGFADPAELTEEDRKYLESGDQSPAPQDEPVEQPEAVAEAPKAADADDPDIEADEAEAAAEDGAKPDGRKVSYGAYIRRKKETDSLREQLARIQEQSAAREREIAAYAARIDERFRALQAPQGQQRPQAAEQPSAPPDPDVDPLGAIRWQTERLAQIEAATHQTAQQRQAEEQDRDFVSRYRHDNTLAQRENPEFMDRYKFLFESRFNELNELYAGKRTADQINAQVVAEEKALAREAIAEGERPAARIWRMAKARGFEQHKAFQAAQASQPAQPAQAAPQTTQARLDANEAARSRNLSLSSAGSSGAIGGPMTVDKFVSMSDRDADAWMKKNGGDLALQRLMGEAV